MFRYLVRRTLWAMLLFLVIMFVTFVIFFIAPNDPARAVCGGETAQRACLVLATREAEARQADVRAVRQLPRCRLVIHQSLGTSYATSQRHQREDREGGAGDRDARLRRRGALDDDRAHGGHPVRPPAAVAVRPIRDGLRPDRRVRAPGLDRADPLVLLRREVAHHADRELRELLRRARRLRAARRALAVVLPHDFALVDVRASVRGALRPHDQGERDGDDERGLRAHGESQGRSGAARHGQRTFSATPCCPSSRCSGWTSASPSAARSSPRRSSSYRA